MRHLLFVISLGSMALLASCGGGGGTATTPVSVDIAWGDRSRAINAPSSALSVVFTLSNANPMGGDFTFSENRDSVLNAHTVHYVSPTAAKAGTWPFAARFYAQANGTGALVGIAQATVTIQPDGTGIGNISTTNVITSVSITAGQRISIGETKDIIFTAKDSQSNAVAVSPGSAIFTIVSGQDKLQLVNGQGKGIAAGPATLTATVDGIVSAAAMVQVVLLPPTAFDVTDLGGPGWNAVSINNSGQVAINGLIPNVGTTRSYLWDNGTLTTVAIANFNVSRVTAINNLGQIIGEADDLVNLTPRSFVWQIGQSTILPLLPGLGYTSVGGLNDVGDMAGTARASSPAGPGSKTILWNNGGITDLGTLGSTGIFVFGISNQKQVIGGATGLGNTGTTAFVLQNGQLTLLPSLGGQGDLARGVNVNGDIVGSSQTGGHSHAAIWQNGAITDLAPAASSSTAFAINSSGQIAGTQAATGGNHAFLWYQGVAYDLNNLILGTSGWTLVQAESINDKGQIVGVGLLNGGTHAYLLTPK